jgi:PIN domain nuclease of toxin-antitoxin system
VAVAASVILDTHLLLWLRLTPQLLTAGERDVIDRSPARHLSAVSLMEIAILLSLRRLPASDSLLDVPTGFDLLPIRPDHCRALAHLPFHHRDPFDRMLVAQAISEGTALLTRDRMITAYAPEATVLHLPEA